MKTDSFVNSQEWTLSRSIQDLRLGVVGHVSSGKSALVHRYLTGSYVEDESPEGGRFKKEVMIDGQSYLLLIRDEAGSPESQFCGWVDAVIFVFSLESLESFGSVQGLFSKLSCYRNVLEIPVILVGTSSSLDKNTRVVDSGAAEKLASDIKRCSYFETCAAYGKNVEVVFTEACRKILQSRVSSVPTTINVTSSSTSSSLSSSTEKKPAPPPPPKKPVLMSSNSLNNNNNQHSAGSSLGSSTASNNSVKESPFLSKVTITNNTNVNLRNNNENNHNSINHHNPVKRLASNPAAVSSGPAKVELRHHPNRSSTDGNLCSVTGVQTSFKSPAAVVSSNSNSTANSQVSNDPQAISATKELITPCSTPTAGRKSTKRRSNIFPNLHSSKNKNLEEKNRNGELGSGRVIPVHQGYLYKKSFKSLNKDWKKKYVTLTSDGTLTYHPTLHDYMNDVHRKDIPLRHTTVKIKGKNGRFGIGSFNLNHSKTVENHDLEVGSLLKNLTIGTASGSKGLTSSIKDSVKKRGHHRRAKSNLGSFGDDSGENGSEFSIVSLENKEWRFEADSTAERDLWVEKIEEQILTSLQGLESDKSKINGSTAADQKATINSMKTIPGNDKCADCDAKSEFQLEDLQLTDYECFPSDPDWASLNLGTVICIECSGIHRNLGTHISKVRSLDLDDWPPAHVSVMMSIGNSVANSVWESRLPQSVAYKKPQPNSIRDEKAQFIRMKYENKKFISPLPTSRPVDVILNDAINRSDIRTVIPILAHGLSSYNSSSGLTPNVPSSHSSSHSSSSSAAGTTSNSTKDCSLQQPIHLAVSTGNLAVTQLLIWVSL